MKKLDLLSKIFIAEPINDNQILIIVDAVKLEAKGNESLMNFGARDSITRLSFEEKFGNKLERAIDFIENNHQIKVPYMSLSSNGDIYSMEGNHRFKAMRELFSKKAVISVSKEDFEVCAKQEWFLNTLDGYLKENREINLSSFMAKSKALDKKGRPIVVYHGTKEDFNSFDKKSRGKATASCDSKHGFFFSSNPDVASSYSENSLQNWNVYGKAIEDFQEKKITYTEMKKIEDWYNSLPFEERKGKKEGANIMPVYLCFKNPKIIAQFEKFEVKAFEFEIAYAKEQGYDSVIFEDVVDDISFMGESSNRGNTYVAFEPTQIKSIFDIKFNEKSKNLNERALHISDISLALNKEVLGEMFLDKIVAKYDSLNDALIANEPIKPKQKRRDK